MCKRVRSVRAASVGVLVLGSALAAAACRGKRVDRAVPAPVVMATEPVRSETGAAATVWAMASEGGPGLVVIPVSHERGDTRTIRVVATADGKFSTPLWLVSMMTRSGGVDSAGPAAGRWMGQEARWVAHPGDTPAGNLEGGQPVVAVSAAALRGSERVSIDGVPIVIRWVKPAAGVGADWAVGEGGSDVSLRRMLAPAFASPWAAWRARLTAGEPLVADAGTGSEVGGEVIGSIDRNQSEVWRAALDRLAGIDSALARSVAARIAGLVSFGGTVRAPVWTVDGPSLALLRADLLAADLDDRQVAGRARAWLEAQPPAAAWVEDDAGLRDAGTGAPMCTVAVANLTGSPVAVSAVFEGGGGGAVAAAVPEMATVPANAVARVTLVGRAQTAQRPQVVVVRVGAWSKRLPVLGAPVGVRPPGLTVGPLGPDASMAMLRAAAEAGEETEAATTPAERTTVGMLFAEAGGGPLRWTLYMECMTPDDGAGDELSDSVSVHLGASGGGERVLKCTPDGESTGGVRVARRADRWLCWVPIPVGAVEHDGRLRIGVVRELTDAGGVVVERSAWPRAMLPWAQRPGRVSLDLRAWSAGPSEGSGGTGR